MSDASTEGNAGSKKAQKSVSDEMKRDKEIKKSQFLVAFGEQLNLELDAIGFVDGRRRSGALAARFDIDRSNGYRILNGVGNPDALYLSKVRTLGVSSLSVPHRPIPFPLVGGWSPQRFNAG